MVDLDQDSSIEDAVPNEAFIRALLIVDQDNPITREDVEQLASAILRTTNICSRENVKDCKDLILVHIISPGLSTERVQVLCKYLVALSRSFVPKEPWKRLPTDAKDRGFDGLGKIVGGQLQQPPQQAFRRLHLLYIVHDLLFWCFKHSSNAPHALTLYGATVAAIKSRLPALVGMASFRGSADCASTFGLVRNILKTWKQEQMFDMDFLNSLYDAAYMADSEAKSWHVLLERLLPDATLFDLELKVEKEPDWLIPSRHGRPGDPEAPWHELPAANGLHMRRIYGYPLQWRALPVGGYELDDGGRKAQSDLVSDVKHLHSELLHCFDQHIVPDDVQDVDALGNIIWKDPERETRNHWGNSYDAVEKRRKLARHFKDNAVGYEGLRLQPMPLSDPRDYADAHDTGMGSNRRQQRGFGDRGGYASRGGFRDDHGGYGAADYGRGGSNRGGYNNRGGYPPRSGYGGRGGRGRGNYNGNGEHDTDFGGYR